MIRIAWLCFWIMLAGVGVAEVALMQHAFKDAGNSSKAAASEVKRVAKSYNRYGQ